jgi:hypothetical protein
MSSAFLGTVKKEWVVHLQSLKDDIIAKRNPNFFWPTGTQVYVGSQGSGKTISAVHHVHKLKQRYPNAVLVTNIALAHFKPREFQTKIDLKIIGRDFDQKKEYIYFQDMEQLAIALTNVNNGKSGVIYLVDEIHTYFNALESKNIPMYVFTEISQQRKQRKLIIGTSQLFLRMAKPFREQCDNLIVCKTYMGIFTTQKAFDGMSITQNYDGSLTGNHKRSGFFFHTRNIRNRFDTFQKVVSGAEQYEQMVNPDLLKEKGLVLKRR